MNKLTPEQRNRLIVMGLATVGACILLWVTLIAGLRVGLKNKAQSIEASRNELRTTQTGITRVEQYRVAIAERRRELDALESKMARGDLYLWNRNYLRNLVGPHDVRITDFDPPEEPSELAFPPKAPYKATTFSVSGTGQYHEFGAYLADLENSSPFVRLNSLLLQAAPPGLTEAPVTRRLNFQMKFSTLVKGTAPP